MTDALVWVQSDFAEAERLGLARDIASGVNGDARAAKDFWIDRAGRFFGRGAGKLFAPMAT